MGGLKSKFRRPKSSTRKEKDSTTNKKKSKSRKTNLSDSQSARKTVDPRLPFSNYRQIFSIRNAWKAVSRTMEDCAKETLLRLFHENPEHKGKFPDLKNITDEEEMRASEDFENVAMDIYQVFDDVVNNLENVDVALNDIRRAAMSFPLNKHMITDMKSPFIDTIKLTLGSDRFTETTEENYRLLYQFVQEEIGKHLTEVEVNSDLNVDSAGKDETNSGNDEYVEKSETDSLTNTEPQKEAVENPAFKDEQCEKSET